MKVWVCRNRKTGDIVDVLPMAAHPKLFPDTLRTFDCRAEDWTAEGLLERHPAAKQDMTVYDDTVLTDELVRRGYKVARKLEAR